MTSKLRVNYIIPQSGSVVDFSGSAITAGSFAGDGKGLTGIAGYVQEGLYMNPGTISGSIAIPAGYNASMTGPIGLADGVIITIPTGSEFVIF